MKSTEAYSPHEFMAIILARDLRDYEVGSSGVAAAIPRAAMSLAQRLHAPNLLNGGERTYNPKPDHLYPDSQDPRFMDGSEAIEGFWELFGHWHKGLDFFFYTGLQIDRFGNVNHHHVGGSYDKPKLRGPGVPNVSLGYTCKRTYLYPTKHLSRVLVESVDFISVPGNLSGPESKSAANIKTAGPKLCVTPLAVFDFDPDTLSMRLKSIHPGVTPEKVQDSTGFDVFASPDVDTTTPPTETELHVLRTQVDPLGVLRPKKEEGEGS